MKKISNSFISFRDISNKNIADEMKNNKINNLVTKYCFCTNENNLKTQDKINTETNSCSTISSNLLIGDSLENVTLEI